MQWTEKRRSGQRAAHRNGRYIESRADRTRDHPAERAAVRLHADRKEAQSAGQKEARFAERREAPRGGQKAPLRTGRKEVLLGELKEAQPAGQKEIRRGEPKEAKSAEQREVLRRRREGARPAGVTEAASVKQKAALCADRMEASGERQKAVPFERQKEAQAAGRMEARFPGGRVQMEGKDQARRQRNCAGIQSGKHRTPAGRNVPERTGRRNGR